MAFAQDGPAMMPSEPFLLPSGFGRNMRSNWISQNASILHVDASFKNPSDIPEEPHRPLLADGDAQHIDMLCTSQAVSLYTLNSIKIYYKPYQVNRKIATP